MHANMRLNQFILVQNYQIYKIISNVKKYNLYLTIYIYNI